MNKRSNRKGVPPSESGGVVEPLRETFRRMDLRGQSERPLKKGPVAADGDRTRYQRGTYGSM